MTADRDAIVDFCAKYLKVSTFKDGCVNGLQVEGKPRISKIVAGVSLSVRLIEQAAAAGAELLLVHHGIFGKALEGPAIKGVMRQRLKLLLQSDMNLLGYHLPLDAHPQIGNNAGLCKLLGVKKLKPLDVGFRGELGQTMRLERWASLINNKLKTNCYVLASGPKQIRRVGVISGGASYDYAAAAEAGCDTLLCGDLREDVVRSAEEMNINIINAGHYNTEKLGVMNLSRLLARTFRVKAEFVDVPCDI